MPKKVQATTVESDKEMKNRLARERYHANKKQKPMDVDDPDSVFSPPTKKRDKLADGTEGFWSNIEHERWRRQDIALAAQRLARLAAAQNANTA